jgi:hypothetical protein
VTKIETLPPSWSVGGFYPMRFFVTDGGLIWPDAVAQYRLAAGYIDRILKMLWGGSGEHISIAALTNPMEPRHDETQNQDCERFQPMSRPLDMDATVAAGVTVTA